MANLPTVKVVADTPEGYALINEKDFDSKQHKRWTDAAKPKSATPNKQTEEPSS